MVSANAVVVEAKSLALAVGSVKQSFLYYVPYATLSEMTFPTIINAMGSTIIGLLALLEGILSSWIGLGLFRISITCCLTVFIAEIIQSFNEN
ncbi:MAG: hypothetical protein MR458_01970 [Erysipelotrichaceae bacterium]|nr:hypothetical protein [Erysipelotrichaceae bacterium]